MRIALNVGHVYSDGKLGLRKLIAIRQDNQGCDIAEYELLAAKQEKAWGANGYESLIGEVSSCLPSSFLAWAKKEMTPEEGTEFLAELKAKRAKWSPTEQEFLENFAETVSISDLKAGYSGVIPDGTNRVARALSKKGVLVIEAESVSFTLTSLGVAAVRLLKYKD